MLFCCTFLLSFCSVDSIQSKLREARIHDDIRADIASALNCNGVALATRYISSGNKKWKALLIKYSGSCFQESNLDQRENALWTVQFVRERHPNIERYHKVVIEYCETSTNNAVMLNAKKNYTFDLADEIVLEE